jgi:carbon dioxide concentrating mechanism protein CcmO
LPVASCWVEKRQPLSEPLSQPLSQPLNLPISIKEQIIEVEVVQLPDLAKLPIKIIEELENN